MAQYDWIRKHRRVLAIAASAAAVITLSGFAVAVSNPAEQQTAAEPFTIVGLTDTQELVAFSSDDTDDGGVIGEITGLAGDRRIVAIDCRVTDSKLYGLGDRGGIYRIGLDDAVATKISQLTAPLDGEVFDIDFNPAAHRLRIVSDSGQNLRHNLDDPAGEPAANTTVTDAPLTSPLAGTATGVSGVAYYNNDFDPDTATTLFGIDTDTDQVVIQSPANDGQLAITGNLGVDASGDAGLEIHYNPSGGDTGGIAHATLDVDGDRGLYRIDLLKGAAQLVGRFPSDHRVVDLAAGFLRDEIEGILLGGPWDCVICDL